MEFFDWQKATRTGSGVVVVVAIVVVDTVDTGPPDDAAAPQIT